MVVMEERDGGAVHRRCDAMRLILRAVRPIPSSLKSFLASPGAIGNQLIRAVADADGESDWSRPQSECLG